MPALATAWCQFGWQFAPFVANDRHEIVVQRNIEEHLPLGQLAPAALIQVLAFATGWIKGTLAAVIARPTVDERAEGVPALRGSKKEHSCKACRVQKELSDITKQQRKLKGEQPCNGVERGGMRCTEAHHPIR